MVLDNKNEETQTHASQITKMVNLNGRISQNRSPNLEY